MKYTTLSGKVADSFAGLRQYDSAIFYNTKWIEEIHQRGTQIYLVAAYGSMADCYRETGAWEESLTYYRLAKALNHKIGLRRSEAAMGKALAQVLLVSGSAEGALEEIEGSLAIAHTIGCYAVKCCFA